MNTQPTPESLTACYDDEHGEPCVPLALAIKIERERDEWKAKFIQQNKDLGCEMMDPNGTIWDYAKKVQSEILTVTKERDEARESLEFQKKLNVELNKRESQTYHELIAVTKERDEARGQLAGIEDKMRVELGGHPNSGLWGEAGLIAATMRCVDALGKVTDQRDSLYELHNKNAARSKELLELCGTLREQRDRLAEVIEAASVLIAAKGRHNTMLAYNGLRDALQSLNPNEKP